VSSSAELPLSFTTQVTTINIGAQQKLQKGEKLKTRFMT